MPTRTAPDPTSVGANATITTLHLIDASGDLYSESLETPTVPALVDVQAWAAAYQAATNTSLWKITQSQSWIGDQDPQNADAVYRGSVKDGINLLWENTTTLQSKSPRLIAPIAAVMQGNQDIPLLSAAPATALLTAIGTILTGYNLVSAQYTERRERTNNPRIKV